MIDFYSGWIECRIEQCPNPSGWHTSIRFKIYHTGKKFAIQFSSGGGQSHHFKRRHPSHWSNSKPMYRKSIDSIMNIARQEMKAANATHPVLSDSTLLNIGAKS